MLTFLRRVGLVVALPAGLLFGVCRLPVPFLSLRCVAMRTALLRSLFSARGLPVGLLPAVTLVISLAVLLPCGPLASSVLAAEDVLEEAAEAANDHLDGEVDHAGEHGAGHGGEHAAGHGSDNPLAAKVGLAAYSLVVFLLFLGLLWKFCWAPLMDGLNQRETNIRGAVDAANKARDEAASLLAEHKKRMAGVDDEVKEIIAEARRDAETTKADIIAKANSEAEAARERSLGDIERARQQALVDLASREQDLVISATEQVLGRSIDETDRQRLIDDALNQFASRN